MERFFNSGSECLVLARCGTTALICMPGNRCTPFVVPRAHAEGALEWWGGSYFDTLTAAAEHYTARVNAENGTTQTKKES